LLWRYLRRSEALAAGVCACAEGLLTETDSSPPLPTSLAVLVERHLVITFDLPSILQGLLTCIFVACYLLVALAARILLDCTMNPTANTWFLIVPLLIGLWLQDPESEIDEC
jgi:hypothetical protein